MPQQSAIEATLFIHYQCPHCPTVMQHLCHLVKTGELGSLRLINLEKNPAEAEALGVRSVPWYQIGAFELEGLRDLDELRQWVKHAEQGLEGQAAYLNTLLSEGHLGKAEHYLSQHPLAWQALLLLLHGDETPMQTRIGIGALIESHAGEAVLHDLLAPLQQLAENAPLSVRNDACHYLAQTHHPDAIPTLVACWQHENTELSEIAAESLVTLGEGLEEAAHLNTTPQDVLKFWFAEGREPQWFQGGDDFDAAIRARFLGAWCRGAGGDLDDWTASAKGGLALTILLDQFPLNMFRGQAASFATEAASREAAAQVIASGADQSFSKPEKQFLYLPYMHSENVEDQARCVELFGQAGMETRWALHHQDIVQRFGRFPHRNAILDRESTPEELAYLASDESFSG